MEKTSTQAIATPPPYEPAEAEARQEPGLYQSAAIEAAAEAARQEEAPTSYPAFLYTPRRSFWDD